MTRSLLGCALAVALWVALAAPALEIAARHFEEAPWLPTVNLIDLRAEMVGLPPRELGWVRRVAGYSALVDVVMLRVAPRAWMFP